MKELYLSFDMEADGPSPRFHSMLSLGCVALTVEKEVVSRFSRNLMTRPNAIVDADTAAFWSKFPSAYEKSRIDPVVPHVAMRDFFNWVMQMTRTGKPVFVAEPSVYDWKWYDDYCFEAGVANPFGFGLAIDINSFVFGMIGGTFTGPRRYPVACVEPEFPHTHVADEDALEQGVKFINLLRHRNGMEPKRGVTWLCEPLVYS